MSEVLTRSQKKLQKRQTRSSRSSFEVPAELPSRPKRLRLTVPEPFTLQSETLSAIAKERLRESQIAEEKRAAELREFKAKESSALGSPFKLKPSLHPLTVPESPGLKSTTRAEARSDFESEKNRRLEEKRLRKEAEQARIAEEERQAALALRETMVIKAKPFTEPLPMVVKRSSKPLTVAVSPMVRSRAKKSR